MRERWAGTIWVCGCCLFTREADGCGHEHEHEHEPKPWAMFTDDQRGVTLGMLREEHECPEGDDECDCETRDFTWSPCEGCGDRPGGARYAYTVWDAAE